MHTALEDIADAVTTVARRSDGLTQFVGSYRRLTRLPAPKRTNVALQDLFARVTTLMHSALSEKQITLNTEVTPSSLSLSVDTDMLEQVLLNLIQNAVHALADRDQARITLRAGMNRRGHVVIEVQDNGPGIPADLMSKVFVPFFTTKRDGSGVGLAFTQQVMIVHGGSVKATNADSGGCRISLTF